MVLVLSDSVKPPLQRLTAIPIGASLRDKDRGVCDCAVGLVVLWECE
jgi:hypothetical protein